MGLHPHEPETPTRRVSPRLIAAAGAALTVPLALAAGAANGAANNSPITLHGTDVRNVLGVDVTDSAAGARSLYRRAGWRHPSIADPNGRIAAQPRLQRLPTTLFLDVKHEVVERTNGQTTAADFAAGYREASA